MLKEGVQEYSCPKSAFLSVFIRAHPWHKVFHFVIEKKIPLAALRIVVAGREILGALRSYLDKQIIK